MKNTILSAIFIAIALVGCESVEDRKDLQKNVLTLDNDAQEYSRNFRVYTLGECEYIVVGYGESQWGTHKGDCKNPIHSQSPIDTSEKHFDCTVEEIIVDNGDYKYMYTTECGISFYSNEKYKKGEVLKNFKSPQHK